MNGRILYLVRHGETAWNRDRLFRGLSAVTVDGDRRVVTLLNDTCHLRELGSVESQDF